MGMTRAENPLGTEKIGRLLKQFCIPSIIAMVVNSIYNIADQIFIQRGVGTNGNAATTVAFPLITFTLAIALLVCNGAVAKASIKMGENNKKEAEHILGNAFLLVILVSVLLCGLAFVFFKPMLRMLGASEAVMPYAEDYVSIILLGTVFQAIGSGLSGFVRADGAPVTSMMGLVSGCAVNLILDPIFVFGFHWGVKGAAFATILSQLITALITLWYLIWKGNIRIHFKYMKLNIKLCVEFVALGLSSFVTQFANALVQISANQLLQKYGNTTEGVTGDIAMTAMGLTMKTNMLLIGICVGIGTGAQPILGYNKGAGKYKRVKEAYLTSVKAATLVSLVGWAMVEFIPGVILSIYGSNDPQLFQFSEKTMRLFLGGVFLAGFNIVSSNYFQAVGKAGQAFILSMARQVFALLPLMYLLPLVMGIDGVLISGGIADFVSFSIGFYFVWKEMKWLKGIIESKK